MTLTVPPRDAAAEIEYPESDGRPLAETDIHRRALRDLEVMLDEHFAADPTVYVSGNLLLYYEEGEPRQSVAPDLFVVRGVPKGERRTYRVWTEGVVPQWILEATSKSTRGEDLGAKKGLYAWLGVQEYVLYDPLAEYLRPPLQGFRLVDGGYAPMPLTDGTRLVSEVLGLELRLEGQRLRLFDPARQRYLLSPTETEAARQAAEAEVARLRAELERLRGERAD